CSRERAVERRNRAPLARQCEWRERGRIGHGFAVHPSQDWLRAVIVTLGVDAGCWAALVAIRLRGRPVGPYSLSPRRSWSRWRGGREAEGGGLLNRYTGLNLYRGFESLPLREESPALRGFFHGQGG